MMQDDIVSGDLLNDEDDEYNLQARSHEGKMKQIYVHMNVPPQFFRWQQSIWKHDWERRN